MRRRIFKHLGLASALHNQTTQRGEPKTSATMFKVERSADGGVVVFALYGRLTGAEVAELHALFEAEAADRPLVLDLQEIKLVDRDVVKFLSRCEAGGIALEHCPAYIREWIRRESAA